MFVFNLSSEVENATTSFLASILPTTELSAAVPPTVNEPDVIVLFINVVHAALEVKHDPIINESEWPFKQFPLPPNIAERIPVIQLK